MFFPMVHLDSKLELGLKGLYTENLNCSSLQEIEKPLPSCWRISTLTPWEFLFIRTNTKQETCSTLAFQWPLSFSDLRKEKLFQFYQALQHAKSIINIWKNFSSMLWARMCAPAGETALCAWHFCYDTWLQIGYCYNLCEDRVLEIWKPFYASSLSRQH